MMKKCGCYNCYEKVSDFVVLTYYCYISSIRAEKPSRVVVAIVNPLVLHTGKQQLFKTGLWTTRICQSSFSLKKVTDCIDSMVKVKRFEKVASSTFAIAS
ncbi:UNVERIFIED_CONTAM: hypothetical protein K2H54_035003 [Gekko kuhli]